MLARNQHQALLLLTARLITLLSLARLQGDSPIDVVHYVARLIGALIVACLLFSFLKRIRALSKVRITTNGVDQTALQ
jgi:hypothetical protein